MESIVIVSGIRSAVGAFNGQFKNLPASDITAQLIAHMIDQKGLDPTAIDQLILGQVLMAGAGQNPARQAGIKGGLPYKVPAFNVSQVCGSGMRAVILAAQQIRCGDAQEILCGGQENMSLAPHLLSMRQGTKLGHASAQDSLLVDGLWDAFNDYHMGITAENLAERYQITREAQDMFAFISQEKAKKAIASGLFEEEITPIETQMRRKTILCCQDEHPNFETSIEALSKLRPAFKKQGSVTAGNSSGINDGAALLWVMSESRAKAKNLSPIARITAWGSAAIDPSIMGMGPVEASKQALLKAGWGWNELDWMELNEAFAAQSLAVLKELPELDPAKVNPNGGAIALGHPLGASAARILVTLIHGLKKNKLKKGLASACIGGGMGIAICVESFI